MSNTAAVTSAFGIVHEITKADRRFSGAPRDKPHLYLARHTPEAQAIRQAGATPKPLPPSAAVRATLRATKIGKV